MSEEHSAFWTWLGRFVLAENIEGMLEIGCGDGRNSELVARYTGVEQNVRAVSAGMRKYPGAQLIHGNWLSIADDELSNGYDLVLAAGVVEHRPHYREFVKKAVGVGAKWTIITFGYGLDWDCDVMATTECQEPPGWVYDNRYSERVLLRWLADNGYADRHEVLTFAHEGVGEDAALIIRAE